jgi:hypothetical protein
MPDRDELYDKYRVFYEPHDVDADIGHPAPIKAEYLQVGEDDHGIETWGELQEADGLHFVLRPEGDVYARIAMATYAYACRKEFPRLAADIIVMIEGLEWEEETGQHRDDFPMDRDDYMESIGGEHLADNVVAILRGKLDER